MDTHPMLNMLIKMMLLKEGQTRWSKSLQEDGLNLIYLKKSK